MPFEDGKPDLAVPSSGHFEDEEPTSSLWRRLVADPAISLIGKGSIGVPETVVGLADLVTGGYAGKGAEALGFRPKEAKAYLDTFLSPEQQEANRYVDEAEGFFPTIGRALEKPSTIAHSVLESLPSVGLGGGVARGLMAVAPKLAPLVAGAMGEGAVSAGSTAEQIRQATPTGTLSLPQAALAAGSGAVTGGVGVAGGKLMHRLGITDIDTLIAAGKLPEGAKKNIALRIAQGAFVEGPLEELPQSAQEQIAQNLALGKPVMEGVPEAGAMGMLAGSVMGGGVAAMPTKAPTKEILDRNPDPRKAAEELLQKAAEDVIRGTDTLGATIPPVSEQITDKQPETLNDQPQLNPVPSEQATPETAAQAPSEAEAVIPESGTIAPKTVAGDPVESKTDEQLQALAAAPETPANTRHAAVAALQSRNPEARGGTPVEENQPSLSPRGQVTPEVVSGQAPAMPEVMPESTTAIIQKAKDLIGEDELLRRAKAFASDPRILNPETVINGVPLDAVAMEQAARQTIRGDWIEPPQPAAIPPAPIQSTPEDEVEDALRRGDFEAVTSKLKARHTEVAEKLTRLMERDGAVKATNGDDRYIILSKGVTGEPYRVTSFDSKGPSGHREYKTVTGDGVNAAIGEFLGPHTNIVDAPAAQPSPAVPKPQPEAAPAVEPVIAPERQVVETFIGQYKKGLGKDVARQQQKRLSAEKPTLTWEIEPAPEFGERFKVVGYAQPAVSTQSLEVASPDLATLRKQYAEAEKRYAQRVRFDAAGGQIGLTPEGKELADKAEVLRRQIAELERPAREAEAKRKADQRETEIKQQSEATAKRVAALPVVMRRNGWEIVKDDIAYALLDPATKEEVYRGKLKRVREVADESPPTPAPASQAPAVVKEPWQMTKAEWADSVRAKYAGDNAKLKAQGFSGEIEPKTDAHFYTVKHALEAGKPVPASVLADYPDLKQTEPAKAPVTQKAPGAKPVDAAKESAERAGLHVVKPDEYAKFAPWVKTSLDKAEAVGGKTILTFGTSKEYALYQEGRRINFDGAGENPGSIVSEKSGNPVDIATRHGEDNIIAMTSAAKKEIDERRAELGAKRAAEDERQQKMQDDLARTTEERRKYFETVATVQLPKGVKKTITVKSQKGEKLELTGTDYDGLFIHKIDNKNEPYSVADTKSGLRIARFPRVDQAKDFIRGVIHANLPRADVTKLSKAELAQWLEVAKTHMAGDEVPTYFSGKPVIPTYGKDAEARTRFIKQAAEKGMPLNERVENAIAKIDGGYKLAATAEAIQYGRDGDAVENLRRLAKSTDKRDDALARRAAEILNAMGETAEELATTPTIVPAETKLAPGNEKESDAGIVASESAKSVAEMSPADLLRAAADKMDSEAAAKPSESSATPAPESAAKRSETATPPVLSEKEGSIPDKNEPLFSRAASSPIFYSALARGLESANIKSAPAPAWAQYIKGLVNKGTVKQDEVEWTGINDWLTTQTGKVTKEQISAFMEQGGVKVTETMLGEDLPQKRLQAAHDALIDHLVANENFTRNGARDYALDAARGDLSEGQLKLQSPESKRLSEVLQETYAARTAAPDIPVTKFEQYQLPGSVPGSYRELVLTLPPPRAEYTVEKDGSGWVVKDATGRKVSVWHNNENDAREEWNALNGRKPAEQFHSTHFPDAGNYLAHTRVNDRILPDGRKVLFVEEIQSDRAQKGRAEGFKVKMVTAPGEPSQFTITADEHQYHVTDPRSGYRVDIGKGTVGSEQEARDYAERYFENKYAEAASREERGIAPAPFVTKTDNWTALVLKRLLRYAAEGDYAAIAWTRGDQQVERYTQALRKAVDVIEWTKTPEGVQIVGYKWDDGLNGMMMRRDRELGTETPVGYEPVMKRTKVVDTTEKESALSDAIGKSMADRIRNDSNQTGTIEGDGITVSDTGMAGFYDRIVPKVAQEVAKKVGGGKVVEANIGPWAATKRENHGWIVVDESGKQIAGPFPSEADATRAKDTEVIGKQQMVEITPAMREKIMGGLPLFAQGKPGGITEPTLRAEISKAFGPKAAAMVGDILIPLETQAEIANVSELSDVVPLIREGDRISGFYHPKTGKTYLVLENIPADEVRGTILHEIGVHLGLEGMLGKDRYAAVVRRMEVMRKAGNKAVIEAHEQAVKQAASPNQVEQETIAYLVTNRPELPFIRRLVAKIKAFLFRKFGILGDRLTPDDIATLAKASVLHASEGVRNGEAQFARVVGANEDGRSADERRNELKSNPDVFWHGSPSGDMRGGKRGLHLGSYKAAKQALEARIGIPLEGEWDGTREYGKTLLKSARGGTGYNYNGPNEPHYPTKNAKYSDGSPISMTVKPNITPYRIVGLMSNSRSTPHEDFKANGYMLGQIKRGTAKRGYFYTNVSEDAGSISIVVPNVAHLERINSESPAPDSDAVSQFSRAQDQMQTEAFKRWFGESKARGVFYHSSPYDFTVFDMADQLGAHFGTNQAAVDRAAKTGALENTVDVAKEGGKWEVWVDNELHSEHNTQAAAEKVAKPLRKRDPMAVYLSIQNPLRMPDLGVWTTEGVRTYLSVHNLISDKEADKVWEASRQSDVDGANALRAALKKKGYDGIVYQNELEDAGSDSYIAFRSTQIKSATDNTGAFDPTNPDIRFQRTNEQEGAVEAPDWVKEQPADMQETLRKAGAWRPKQTLQERFADWTVDWQKKLKQGMVDQFDPIKSLDYHAYMLARMSKSSAGPLESALFDGTVFIDKDGAVDVNYEKGGFIGRMQALKGEHDRFFAWVIGNRAARLMEEGREHNFSKEDIARLKTLNRGKMADGSSREATYMKSLADLNRYNKSILDIAQKAGLIDGESRPFWEKDFYIPFYRMTEGDTPKGPVKSGGLVRQYAFKTLKGGKQAIGDPMENILKNWAHLIDASLKNQAGVASLDAAVKVGVAHETTADEKGAVFVMKNGVKTYYVVDDPFVLDAINSLGFSGFGGPAMKVMTSFKRWLTFGVTISPTFRVRNVIRDSISMIGTNPASYNVLDNVLTGWRLTKEDSPSYASMIAGGGVIRFGTLEQDGATNIKRIVASGVDAGTILDNPAKVKAMLKSAYDQWMHIGDRSENVNRAALYQKLRDEGKSHLEASYAARDTMDFSMMGTWSAIRFLAQTVPFFNARLQGLYKLGRGAAEDPRRFAYVVGATALASMALLLAYSDDDDWKQREDFDRESFWWFKIGDKAFRIPKPFEIGAIGTLAERGLEALITDDLTGKQFAQRMGSVVGQQLSMNPVPQLFMPMIEMWANKDSFTSRPIESMGMEKLSPSERISPHTSAFAQLAGKNGIVSPVQIDHIINGYFGWLGTHAVATADLALRPVMDLPAKPSMRVDDVFALGDFVRDMPAYQSKYVTRLYEQSREVQQVMADMRAHQKIGATEKAAEILKEQGDKIRLYRLYTHAEKQLTKINQEIKVVQRRSGDVNAKRARLNQLYAQKNRVAKLTEQRAQLTLQ